MKFTIEEINEAWTEFTRPMWMVDNRQLDPEQIEKGVIEVENLHGAHQLPQRMDFISWLISWKSKRKVGSETPKRRLKKEQVKKQSVDIKK